RRAPIAVRLAVRDLARYRARSGAALGAISLSVLIAVIICVTAAARFGNVLDWAGPNLAADQLVVYTPDGAPGQGPGPQGSQQVTRAQLAAMPAEARGIGASLGSRDLVQLDTTDSMLRRAAPGRDWNGAIYVATPELLRAFGITAAQINPDTDI